MHEYRISNIKYQAPALLAALALALLPLAIWAEHADKKVWGQRLVIPSFEATIDRHTPIHTEGTFLPPTISSSRTLTAADNPIILPSQTVVAAGATLTLEAGTRIFAHEFANLTIDGAVNIRGTADKRVAFASNELHERNQIWNGIVIRNGGVGTIAYTDFEFASPALTCEEGSQLTADHLDIKGGQLGLFTRSPACRLVNSIIRGVRTGVIAIGIDPQVVSTTISATNRDIQTFPSP